MLSGGTKANSGDSPDAVHKERPPPPPPSNSNELTSFPETLKTTNFDEREMKDVQLYDENISFDETIEANDRQESQKNEAAERRHREADPPERSAADIRPKGAHYSPTAEEEHKFESLSSITGQFGKTVVILATDEDPVETFERLKEACINGTLPYKDIIDSLFNTLVGGPFDLESRYVIDDSNNINRMIELLELCPQNVQAEIWSVFVAIIRKSFLNLGAATEACLISQILDLLPNANSVTSDLLIELLTVLTNYSISVKEVKYLLRFLRISDDGFWKPNSTKLFGVMKEMPKRDGPDVFFLFPGKASAGISLPPLLRWPYQNGWTFSTWLRMDPLNSIYFEKEKPYLFSFSTSKGLGYFCYFMGNCLVLRCVRAPGKETLHCVKHELLPRKWHHVALSFVYSRWAKSEIHCFVDGYLVEAIDANWLVSTADHFDRCFVGCGAQANLNEAFSGQMAAVYVFSQAITPPLVTSLLYLGVSYQSQFKHEAESNLPESYRKHLFDGRLHESLVFAYCPTNCHDQLCLFQQQTQKGTQNPYFVQIPHAVMKNGVKLVKTHSIHSSLHSIGGIQVLLPLFSQIDAKQHEPVDDNICANLLSVVSILLSTSTTAQQQFLHVQGFTIIASTIVSAESQHLSMHLLEGFISVYKALLNFSIGLPLLKQLIENVFLTANLWIRADPSVQVRLYDFLTDDLFASANNLLFSIVRRTHSVVTLMYTLKKCYWIVRPAQQMSHVRQRTEAMDRLVVVHIRSCILQIVNRLMFTFSADANEKEINRDDEFQCILNFVLTVHEDDNLYDVLTQLSNQIANHPATMVPAFDRKKALCVIFKLISSANELIRIPALKIFGYYLCRSTQKRKNESINQKNLFHLLTEKLLLNCRSLTLATYNALFEILVEQICPEILFVKHEDPPLESTRFENHQLLKVTAQLLCQSEECAELIRVKCVFLRDVIRICEASRENRRTVLQLSVWQEWLISLAYIYPDNEQQKEVTELVYELFSILLFHAIRLEYGGWRVWVDSMAIAHSKVSWEKYRRKILQKEKRMAEERTAFECQADESEQPMALYRTPDYTWSTVHIRLLSDLLEAIESVVQEWNDSGTPVAEHLNNTDNQVFIANTIHLLSQLSDSLTMACGGLLPLLAAATAPNSELEINDTTQQELDIFDAARFLTFFAELSDVFVFASGVNLNELEQEKNMPSGGILRQTLRLVSTVTVRNILACIVHKEEIYNKNSPKFDAIRKFCGSSKSITDFDRLLQSVDLQRLKGVIYRDMEETKQAQFLALAVVYFLSVLMVSRYRDILEPPSQTPSPSSIAATNPNGSPTEDEHNKPVEEPSSSANDRHQIIRRNGVECNGGDSEENGGKISAKTPTSEDGTAEICLGRKNEGENAQGANGGGEGGGGIAAIRCENSAEEVTIENKYGPAHLENFNAPDMRRNSAENTGERRQYLTTKLQKALESVMPLFREILSDFRSFLQKTLLGTHGQEIMNDVKVLQTLKNGSVVEIVMLLCSQEWQTSLQKHAGLAFIELVNEGRLMAHATRDHILRVANEADFILNRLRAEDVSKHAQFESESNEQLMGRKAEELLAEQLLTSSKHREFVLASRALEKIGNVLTHPHGPWSSPDQKKVFWKLDVWEDDSRRRRRFVQNPWGKRHILATIQRTFEQQKTFETNQEQFLKDLSHKMITAGGGQTKGLVHEFMDEADIEKWLKNESDLSEPIEELTTFSTSGKLIAPGLVIPGTISLTENDLFFDADEEHAIYKQQNPSVG
uniref:BEACH-type PH domain-containing protein n=1 Tax=Globodera rostochiensis TaxID=31243 RepID=A0A914GZ48_GLORO